MSPLLSRFSPSEGIPLEGVGTHEIFGSPTRKSLFVGTIADGRGAPSMGARVLPLWLLIRRTASVFSRVHNVPVNVALRSCNEIQAKKKHKPPPALRPPDWWYTTMPHWTYVP